MFNFNHSCTVYVESGIVDIQCQLSSSPPHFPQAADQAEIHSANVRCKRWLSKNWHWWQHPTPMYQIKFIAYALTVQGCCPSQIFHVISALGQSAYQMTTSVFDLWIMAITKLTLFFFVVSYWILLNLTWNEVHNTAYTLTSARCCCVTGQGLKDTRIWTATSSSAFFMYEFIHNPIM